MRVVVAEKNYDPLIVIQKSLTFQIREVGCQEGVPNYFNVKTDSCAILP